MYPNYRWNADKIVIMLIIMLIIFFQFWSDSIILKIIALNWRASFSPWRFFSRKIGRSIVATKATSHDRYCPLSTSWRARPMGLKWYLPVADIEVPIFSLSASTDIITDITPYPVSPQQASVRSSTGIFSVYRRASCYGLLGKSIVSRTSSLTQRAMVRAGKYSLVSLWVLIPTAHESL